MVHSLRTSIFILFLFQWSITNSLAQKPTYSDTIVHTVVDAYPILVANNIEYNREQIQIFVKEHLKWPDPRIDCEGSVMISLIIEKDGSVGSKKFLKTLCPKFNEEAMRVVSLMETWKSGVLNGNIVRTKTVIPIRFYIQRE
jgi:hypothetical protein